MNSKQSSPKLGFYKKYISPFLHVAMSPFIGSDQACRFTPTCSDYYHQSVLKYGIIRGSVKGIYRILRCNPLFKGGYDPA